MRLLLDVTKGIKELLPELAVSVRLNIDDFVAGGIDSEEAIKIAKYLEKAGVDIINCSCGTYKSGLTSIEPASYAEGWRVYLAEEVKKHVSIPVMTGGVIRTPQLADHIIKNNQADFVFLGRSLLADSEWANKAVMGQVDEIRPCITCNNCIDNNFKGLRVDCTVNPRTGRDNELYYFMEKTRTNYKAAVIGSGPAGMQAALSLQNNGFQVTLYEKDDILGGLLNLAAVPPGKERIGQLRDYFIRQL